MGGWVGGREREKWEMGHHHRLINCYSTMVMGLCCYRRRCCLKHWGATMLCSNGAPVNGAGGMVNGRDDGGGWIMEGYR